MTDKTAPDWELIERDYRAGILTLRELAAPHNVTEGAVRKRAKRDGWERDLGPKIKAKADALVRRAEVREEVRKNGVLTERIVIEANAERIAQVRGEHRADITRMRALVLRLLEECEAEAAQPELFAELGELLRNPDERGQDRMAEAYQKAISLPQRIKGVKELAETMKTLIGLEREAYGLDEDKPDPAKDAAISTMTPNEIARRIAFALALGLQQKEQGK